MAHQPSFGSQSIYETEHAFEFAVKAGVAMRAVNGVLSAMRMVGARILPMGKRLTCAHAEHQARGGDVVLDRVWLLSLGLGGHSADCRHRYYPDRWSQSAFACAGDHCLIRAEMHAPVALPCYIPVGAGSFRHRSIFVSIADTTDHCAARRVHERVFELLARYDGAFAASILAIKGCNLLLFWGAPAAENDIQRALDFALDLQATDLIVRMGITFRMGYAGFAGAPVVKIHLLRIGRKSGGAKMMTADWGTVLLDGVTAAKADRFDTTYVKHVLPFKGFAEPQPVYTLNGRRDQVRDHVYAGQLVGRDRKWHSWRQQFRPILTINLPES